VTRKHCVMLLAAFASAIFWLTPQLTYADGNLQKVNHIIVVMQENHSFDNYFGVLALAPGSPYHPSFGACSPFDHKCVDGLACFIDQTGNYHCANLNPDADNNHSLVFAFHDPTRCTIPDLDHSWLGTHKEMNFEFPNATRFFTLSDGFVNVNDQTEQIDTTENATEDETIGFYNQNDLPFYYDLAGKFSLNDRYFASVLGPTFPNRSYLMAATSFGHLTTSDTFPPTGGYKPITGTIFDLLDQNGVTWADYFQDAPQGGSFRPFSATAIDPHFHPLPLFLAQAAGVPGVGPLPAVSFVDPNFGIFGNTSENDEHPPTDIQRGQAYVSQVVNTVRNGPFWKDSIIIITYDEHGGYYDHVHPPIARQGGARNPDGINPGQCEDLSNSPASLQPGGGAECSANLLSKTDTSVNDAEALCPELAANPTGPFPAQCANFDQLGVRVPMLAISPFSKPSYVSHTVGSHTSLLALIEKRFLNNGAQPLHLTKRDEFSNTLEDLFDFDNSPSLNTPLIRAAPPVNDCTPGSTAPSTP